MMMRHKVSKRPGFTLVEVMVFSVVSLMFIGLLAQLFITATRRTEDSRRSVDLQQTGLFVLKKISADLSKASVRSISSNSAARYVLSLTRVGSWDGNSSLLWETNQIAYIHDPATSTLYREVIPSDASELSEELLDVRPYLLSPGELQAIGTNSSGRERILSSHVEEFRVTDRSGSTTSFQSMPLTLELKFRRPLSSSERYAEFTIERRYTLRNTF